MGVQFDQARQDRIAALELEDLRARALRFSDPADRDELVAAHEDRGGRRVREEREGCESEGETGDLTHAAECSRVLDSPPFPRNPPPP